MSQPPLSGSQPGDQPFGQPGGSQPGDQPGYQPGYQPDYQNGYQPPAYQQGAAPQGYQPGYQPGYPAPARKPRPRAWWFAVGAGLMVIGVVALVAGILVFARGISNVDATIPAKGNPVQVTLSTTGKQLIWGHDLSLDTHCTVTDSSGSNLPVRSLSGSSFTKSGGSGSWHGIGSFETTSPTVSLSCVDDQGSVQVGPYPDIGKDAAALVIGIIAVLVLGLSGFIILVVTGILFISRPSRKSLAV